jgi:hypothetical protein
MPMNMTISVVTMFQRFRVTIVTFRLSWGARKFWHTTVIPATREAVIGGVWFKTSLNHIKG